ncbi:hypothetical protein IFM89_020866 [Coptis chinensis]|uniref:DELLA protein n=1 Tax=Coptis chinensis TaxID=261450 RepID=A0A835IUC4_9MAGN|nr:hypothetical protein IFM89_020866 [Coptis chinensis]
MKRTYQDNGAAGGGTPQGGFSMEKASINNKMCWQEEDAGDDELLAVLGYNVRSSDMADVASKIEQLEMMMGSSSAAQEDVLLSHLGGSDTVHYNPSDLSTWLESMICEAELSLPQQQQQQSSNNHNPYIPPAESSTTIKAQIFDEPVSSNYDLSAIPGEIIYGEREKKRIKQEIPSISSTESTRPVVLIDSQENGIRLVHTLMAAAEAVQQDNLKLAESLVKQISLLAVSQAGAMRKVATYFAEALARRIYGYYPQPTLDSSFSDILQIHFYETCPHLKFAHFTANQAILDSFADSNRVHIIDFSMKQGIQWPALMQALAKRPNGPPSFRLTGIGPPQPDNTDALQQVGWKLAQVAENLHVEFEYRGFVCNSLADLDASILDFRPGETVAVNSMFELHQLLAQPNAIDKVLGTIKEMKPKIVTIVEEEANHNGPIFFDRFTEALHYYSTLFDSLEGYANALLPINGQDLVMSEMYFGRQICNLVACEGVDRVERHESLSQWKNRMESAGFGLSHLGSNTYRQVSSLLSMFGGGGGYIVDENNGCLLLAWHTRPLVASSAWQLCVDSD